MKNNFNVNNNTVYYSRKQTWHHHRSITNLSTIREELLKIFLIVIICMLSKAMAQSSKNSNTTSKLIDCKALTTSSLSYQFYDFERYTMSMLKYNSFIQKCKSHPSDEDESNDLIYNYRNYLLPISEAHCNFNLFIFDFRVIKNDLVYVVSE